MFSQGRREKVSGYADEEMIWERSLFARTLGANESQLAPHIFRKSKKFSNLIIVIYENN